MVALDACWKASVLSLLLFYQGPIQEVETRPHLTFWWWPCWYRALASRGSGC